MREYEKQGISYKEYCDIHAWIRERLSNERVCDICGYCAYAMHRALKKGCIYERNVDSFLILCEICHRRYDLFGFKTFEPESIQHKLYNLSPAVSFAEKLRWSLANNIDSTMIRKYMCGHVQNEAFGWFLYDELKHFEERKGIFSKRGDQWQVIIDLHKKLRKHRSVYCQTDNGSYIRHVTTAA